MNTRSSLTIKQRLGRYLIPRLPVNERTFSILRFELNAFITRFLNLVSPRVRAARARLKEQQHLNVNLGSGGRGTSDWVNIDVRRHHPDISFPYDIRQGLPFQNEQVARIFAEHVIEHVEFREDLPRILKEMHRVLEPGGRVRIIVPHGRKWTEAYVSQDPELWAALGIPTLPDDMPTPMAMLNHVFHQGGEHFFAYDFETLKYVLEQAGFENIGESSYNTSDDPQLSLDRAEHAAYSLYVEAQK